MDYYSSSLGSATFTRGGVRNEIMAMGRILSVEHQTSLIRPFSEEDVKIALFNIDRRKSPGSDGFGSGFFKEMWLEIGSEVSKAVL